MLGSREPAVAGMFYPGFEHQLRSEVDKLLSENIHRDFQSLTPKGIIAPHAGYVYSGPIAASVYNLIRKQKHLIKRIVILGPSHKVPLMGIATCSDQQYETPLGAIKIDREALMEISGLPSVQEMNEAHQQEHSLEVHLPFLQAILDDFVLVPLVVGQCDAVDVATVIKKLWGGDETLIIVSSDLSHYHPYDMAKKIDHDTTSTIENLSSTLNGEQACGCYPMNGLLKVAKEYNLSITTVDVRNSGDTAGDKDRVVGYGGYVLC